MSISLYSSATVDSLLSPKLSISSLSNAAATTLNATAPTTGQALTYDGTDLVWATVGGGGGSFLPLTGGTVTGPIIVDESATSGFTTTYSGALISMAGGSMYISQEEGLIEGFNISLALGGYVNNVGSIAFSDSTTQSTAAVPFNGGTVGSAISVTGSGGTVSIGDSIGLDLSGLTAGAGIKFADSTVQYTAAVAGPTYTADKIRADGIAMLITYFPYYTNYFTFNTSSGTPVFMTNLGATWGIYELGIGYQPVSYISGNNAYFSTGWTSGTFYIQVNGTDSSFSF